MFGYRLEMRILSTDYLNSTHRDSSGNFGPFSDGDRTMAPGDRECIRRCKTLETSEQISNDSDDGRAVSVDHSASANRTPCRLRFSVNHDHGTSTVTL